MTTSTQTSNENETRRERGIRLVAEANHWTTDFAAGYLDGKTDANQKHAPAAGPFCGPMEEHYNNGYRAGYRMHAPDLAKAFAIGRRVADARRHANKTETDALLAEYAAKHATDNKHADAEERTRIADLRRRDADAAKGYADLLAREARKFCGKEK